MTPGWRGKPQRVEPITEGRCKQRWPKKDGTPFWRCKDRIAWYIEGDDGTTAALMCQRHFDAWTEPAA